MFVKFAKLVMMPLVFLNIFSGIIAFIWLAVVGEWSIIGYGVLGLLVGHFVISILLMPGIIFMLPLPFFFSKGLSFLGLIFGIVNLVYTNIIFCFWCIGSFFFFGTQITDSSIFIPLVLWSYNVAIGPINYLASKEPNDGTQLVNFFVQIACSCLIIQIIFFNSNLLDSLILFAIIMCIGTFINVKIGISDGMLQSKNYQ